MPEVVSYSERENLAIEFYAPKDPLISTLFLPMLTVGRKDTKLAIF